MKHVVFIIPTLTGGGAERVILTLAKFLDRARFRITLAVVDMRNAALRADIPQDVEFLDLGAARVRYALPKIVSMIRRTRPDVVFSTLGHLNVAVAMVRFLLPRKVWTVARETTVISCSMRTHRNRALWRKMYRWFYRHHDEVICQSRYMRDDLVENYRYPLSRTKVIHNPVDVERIRTLAAHSVELPQLAANAVVLMAAGRLDPEKGFDLLIDAFTRLERAEVHLVILGEGPLETDLKRRAMASGARERIHFVGFQPNPFAWFARANALVLSSHYEGFPNVVLEALACGTPVIATPAPGGTREILDGVEGCEIAAEVSSPALSEAIARWLNGPRRKIDATVVDRYRVERIVREYETALSKDPRA